jgi:5-methylcytosine-specific restriction endonuclease McrA
MAKHFYSGREWLAIRAKALARDQYSCVMCGASVRAKGASRVDHIHPVKSHPHLKLELSNLRTLCPACDNRRHIQDKLGHKPKDIQSIGLDGFPDSWR